MNSREHNIPNSCMPGPTKLQVLICTYGADGIARTASCAHPPAEGVEYLVSWQCSGDTPVPSALDRRDITILRTPTKGLSANRNHALAKSTAPLLLISDDDVNYTEERLKTVISAFDSNPDADLLSFIYESEKGHKRYPATSFQLSTPPKGYYLSSIELAFRSCGIRGKIWFNENFGIGAAFPSGEEELFLHDCLSAGLEGKFIPTTIARHDSDTTSMRDLRLPSRPRTKGALFLRLHPRDWTLRMAAHALRETKAWLKGKSLSPFSYATNWLKGVKMARRLGVFPTPDYSKKYLRHND